jgi:DNA-binding transcriptional regulator YiaG
VDCARIDATSEAEIAQHMREDGENPDAGLGVFTEDVPPTRIREQIGMTQVEFAKTLRIPVATLRKLGTGPGPH